MKELYCDRCGKVAAKLETGSMIKKNSIIICGDCNDNDDSIFDFLKTRENNDVDLFRSMFGMK
jgi:hypothetical protein